MSDEERIDRVEAAQRLLELTIGLSADVAQMVVSAAQVHATLALVEQQRLANLIALVDHADGRFEGYAGEAGGMGVLFSYPEEENGNIRIRDDIRKALGL